MHERISFLNILYIQNHTYSMEIGSRQLGSLQFISKASEIVYCLDIDKSIEDRLQKNNLTNIRFLCGDTKNSLVGFFESISEDQYPTFIHIDGDHTTEGAYFDVNTILHIVPKKMTFIMVHDSFNPYVRKALRQIDINSIPNLSYVDFDFCPGILHSRPGLEGQIWGGFTLFVLSPQIVNKKVVLNNFEATYQAMLASSPLYQDCK